MPRRVRKDNTKNHVLISLVRKSKVKCTQHDGESPCRLCVRAGRPRELCILEELPKARQRREGQAASRRNPPANPQSANVSGISSSSVLRTSPDVQIDAVAGNRGLLVVEPLFQDVSNDAVVQIVELCARSFPELCFIHSADFIHQLQVSDRQILIIELAAMFALCLRSMAHSWVADNCPRSTRGQFAAFVRQGIWHRLLKEPEPELVHCLVIIAQYEWGEGNGYAAWMFIGLCSPGPDKLSHWEGCHIQMLFHLTDKF
jgi:hypothetical protein